MADTDIQTESSKLSEAAASSTRRAAEAARKTGEAVADAAHAGVQAEQRSFGAARDAGRQGAEAITRAAQTSLKTSQDLARQATDQAAEFWRSSLTPMSQMQSEFSRWVEQFWRQASPARGPFGAAFPAAFTGQPVADLRETEQGLELAVELAGLKPDDIDLSLRGDSLVLSGERAEESNGKAGAYHVSERRFGRFERSFPLPAGADRSKIEAKFQDGLLRVAIPISPEGQADTPIPVKG